MYKPAKYQSSSGVPVEAVQFVGNFETIEGFVGGDVELRHGKLLVATPQGPLWAFYSDWIIKTPDGEFKSCAPGVFATSYTKRDE